MYTRLVLNVAVNDSAPADVVEELKRMVNGEGTKCGRLAWMFHSSSYYHDAIQHASIVHDDISSCWKLSVCCDLKNYESEIEEICTWLAPHVETTSLAGYKRYEESAAPDLLYFVEGKAVWFMPNLPESLRELS